MCYIFQFPLWDTAMQLNLPDAKELSFQFPLWDTMQILDGLNKYIFELSIPFMGYNPDGSVIITIFNFQFPLWDT